MLLRLLVGLGVALSSGSLKAQESVAPPEEEVGTVEVNDSHNDQEPSQLQDQQSDSREKEEQDGWGGRLSARYAAAVDAPSDPFSVYGLAMFATAGAWNYSVSQSVTHNSVEEEEGKDEFVVADTYLSLGVDITHGLSPFQESLSFSATLPVSEYSQTNGIRSLLGFAWTIAYPLGAMRYLVSPFFNYQINEFQTTASVDGSGGFPLPQMVYGLSASLGYSFWEQFRAGLSASYSELRYEETGADHISYAADHPYSLSSTLGWAGESGLSLGLSYVNGNQLEQYGGIDFFIFDQYSSSWSVQAGYQF